MKLNASGTISGNLDGFSYNARLTEDGKWMVTRLQRIVGIVDTLAEIDGLIMKHRERVRARLAEIERRAGERRAAEVRELAEITAATKRGN